MGARKIIKKFNKKIHFSFILLIAWYLLTNNLQGFITFCFVVLSHEFGHYFVAKKLGYKLDNFYIAPYGVCLNYKEKIFEQSDEIKIAIAGPIVNIFLSIFIVMLWWVFPQFYNFSYRLVWQSLLLGLFNLLPCYPLDGGRIFVGLLSSYFPRKKAVKMTTIFNIVISILLLGLFVISCFINFNPTFCLCGVFMLLGIVDGKNECRYQPISLFKKKTKNFSKPLFLSVKSSVTLGSVLKHIEENKYTIFVIIFASGRSKLLDEQAIKLLSLSYSLYMSFDQIFKQEKE